MIIYILPYYCRWWLVYVCNDMNLLSLNYNSCIYAAASLRLHLLPWKNAWQQLIEESQKRYTPSSKQNKRRPTKISQRQWNHYWWSLFFCLCFWVKRHFFVACLVHASLDCVMGIEILDEPSFFKPDAYFWDSSGIRWALRQRNSCIKGKGVSFAHPEITWIENVSRDHDVWEAWVPDSFPVGWEDWISVIVQPVWKIEPDICWMIVGVLLALWKGYILSFRRIIPTHWLSI